VKGHRVFADVYDRMSEHEPPRLVELRGALAANARGRVLEIGAGVGTNIAYYGDAVTEIVATEPDPFMLRRLRRHVAALGRPVRVEPAAAESLPFADASFDTVVSALVLCTVTDQARALAEAKRVLKPDGRLLFLEHVRGEGLLGRAQDVILPAWRYCAAGCHPNRRTARALTDAGFQIESLQSRPLSRTMPAILGTARPT
jgi:SAM-dependent methyltransferase